MHTYRALPLFVGLLLATSALYAQQSTDLQNRMSADEFKAAGLDKLSPQELQQLNGWLQTHAKTTTKMVDASGAPVFYPKESGRPKINAHLVGTFSGWTGKSLFKLDNGQTWQQAESGSNYCPQMSNPSVQIKPMMLGSWLMYVDGCSASVRVKRIS
jgi:hypothetical protein